MPRIAVVGTGPVGLATADQLAEAGYEVLMISPPADATGGAEQLPIRETHRAALALWTPFSSGLSAAAEKRLSQKTLEFYRRLDLQDDECGVKYRIVEHYWPEGTCTTPAWVRLAGLDYRPLPYGAAYQCPPEVAFRLRCEYAYRAPVIDVDRFCRWYRRRLLERENIELRSDWTVALVGSTDQRESAEAIEAWAALFDEHQVQGAVLCTGVGSVYDQLCDDEQISARQLAFKKGVTARVAASVAPDERAVLFHGGMFDRDALCYVPHDRGYVIGGTVDPAAACNTAADWQVHADEIAGIRCRAATFLPADCRAQLQAAGFWADDPAPGLEWRAGVRPMLANGGPVVGLAQQISRRFGKVLGRPLPMVAHFGHGGSGFTLCHDTAARAVAQIAAAVTGPLVTR